MVKLSDHYTDLDPHGGCLYVNFSSGKTIRTLELTDSINVDLGVKGKLIGIEFVGFNKGGLS